MSKRVLLAIPLLAAMAGGTALGWQWWSLWRFEQNTDDAYVQSDITPISSKVTGHVVVVEVRDNQPVRKGEVLLRIDPRDLQARQAEAEAIIEARRASIANLETRLAAQQALVAQSEAEIGSAEAERKRSRQDLDRASSLVAEQWVSRQRFDTSQADASKAQASLRRTQAAAEVARRQLAVLASEREVAQANLKQAEAALRMAVNDLDDAVLRAPVDGTIGNRGVRTGQFVRAGQTLMAVVPVDAVWVEANFKETQIGRMQPGQPVSLKVDAFPGLRIEGRIDSFAPASGAKFSLLPPENATGNFTKVVQRIPVRITLDSGHALAGKLRPGMSVLATVRLDGPTKESPPPQVSED